MSFTSEIKQEIAYNDLKDCCKRAELSALIQFTSSLTMDEGKWVLLVRSENPTCSRRIVYLLKKRYGIRTQLTVVQKTNLRKNNVYLLKILSDGKELLEELGLWSAKGLLDHPRFEIVKKDCCARAYVAGAFIAYGSCNSPSHTNYHLEISFDTEEHAAFVQKLITRFGIESKISHRRNKFLVYLKKADAISDFLRLTGAHESLMSFENSRINRDFKNSLTRLNNCEFANEIKSFDAAKRQIDSITRVKEAGKLETLDEKLRYAAEIRLRYPDYTLLELCEEYQRTYGETLSKSGLKHRLNKLETIAKGL
ncbi:MAG: DNA-binding protein WhiA [Erysipelotrichaceae bacterium]|nr:DNA-binding protein WhiA [Erysipelotrichaceae bacterium]